MLEEKLQAFLALQEIVLNNEDSATLVNNLFSKLLFAFSTVNLNYQFISAIFLDPERQITQSFFIDQSLTAPQNSLNNFIFWQKILQKEGELEKILFSSRPFLLGGKDQLISSTYPEFNNIQEAVVSPLLISNKLIGVFVIADTQSKTSLDIEESEIISLVSNLINLSYRLQDTQTSLTKITQDVYKMNAELHQLDNLKDDFVSIASHELRTPMTAIRSYVWMALHRSDIPLSEKLKRYLYRTLTSTERLINLVNDLLNISRIESGRIEILPKIFDIVALVDDVAIEVTPKAKEKNIQINIIKTQIPQVFADEDKIRQVLLNLIGNALKFTPLDGKIEISFLSDGQFVSTMIKDTGVGILKDDLQRLFKKFGRLDNSYVAAATSDGTGLGLFISKKLVELMRGSIKGYSPGLNMGTTFTFSLPAAIPSVMQHPDKYIKKVTGEVKYLEPVAI